MPTKPTSPRTRTPKAKTPGTGKAAAGKSPKPVRVKPAGARSVAMGEMPVIDLAETAAPLGEASARDEADMDQDEGAAVASKAGQGASLIRLKHLIEQVAEATGSKKQDVKPVIEATLARLGTLLGQGESLSLQGFGTLRVIRPATADNPVIRLKLRLADASKGKASAVEED